MLRGSLDRLHLLTDLDENARMTDCYFEKKDWRACAAEVRCRLGLCKAMH